MFIDSIKYGQYRSDIFNKLNFNFESGKKLLDVGCGDCVDAEILSKEYGLDVHGVEIFKHENADRVLGNKFNLNREGIYSLNFEPKTFDYIFMHDVLHHIDEDRQSHANHSKGLENLKNIIKPGGYIVIVEGNRYNPLFYPHMVKMLKHEHFSQEYFKSLITGVFKENVTFKFFECHFYPSKFLGLFKIYENLMEKYSPKSLLAYNVAIIKL